MNKQRIVKHAAVISGISGLVILASSIWPIIEYQLTDAKSYTTLLTPLVLEKNDENKERTDYTKASNWFPTAENTNTIIEDSKVGFYNISIPKLKIEDVIL